MGRDVALRAAIDLLNMPSQVRALTRAPLPQGTALVLGVAAGEPGAELEAAQFFDRPKAQLREAAGFYIEQILMSPNSDSYRILGARQDATTEDLRSNMAMLMRWLHPDINPGTVCKRHAGRVIKAWDDVKSPERRQAYDAALRDTSRESAQRKTRKLQRNMPRPGQRVVQPEGRWLRRVLAYFLDR